MLYSNLTDNELYVLLAQDNEKAFAILHQRYWKRMLYKAMLKLQSESDAEEVVQDAFIDLWKSRHRVTIQNTFHTYIAAIICYKVMARMASNKKEIADPVEDIQMLYVADNSTEQWLSFNELRGEIESAVKGLPEKCQLIFRLSRDTGMKDKEIARDLDISQKTVEAHISRALKSLRISMNRFLALPVLIIGLLTTAS